MDYDICYMVTNGFSARMITQTDLLQKLSINNKVAVITVDDTDINLRNYCQKNNIGLFNYRKKFSKHMHEFYEKRRYYLEDIKENPALWEKHLYLTKYNRPKNPIKLLKIYYWYLMFNLIKFFPFIRSNYLKHEKKYLIDSYAESLIEEINPKLLISTYPVDIHESSLLYYGNKNKNITTLIQFLSWDNISSKGKFIEKSDKYIVWGEIMKNELISYYGVEEKNIYKCGVPHFDVHLNNKNIQENKKKYIFLA